MATNQDLPATDSAAVLHELVGDDATAAFENDPKFIDGNAGETSSSKNLQTPSDRKDVRSESDLNLRTAADDDDDDEEDDEDEDDDLDDEEDEDLDDEDDDLDEEEDDEDDEYEDDDDDEDEEAEE